MEIEQKVDTKTDGNFQPSEEKTPLRSLPRSELTRPKPTTPDRFYLATVAELILKSVDLAGQDTLSESELGRRSMAWAEVLFENEIPETELKNSFNQAFKDSAKDFPINAVAIKNGYQRLLELRSQKIKESEIRNSQANATDEMQCDFCFNSGWVSIEKEGEIYYSVPLVRDNWLYGVRKCHVCDYWERRLAKLS